MQHNSTNAGTIRGPATFTKIKRPLVVTKESQSNTVDINKNTKAWTWSDGKIHKMMERLNLTPGQGLGKNEQGRLEPVSAGERRAQREGIGHNLLNMSRTNYVKRGNRVQGHNEPTISEAPDGIEIPSGTSVQPSGGAKSVLQPLGNMGFDIYNTVQDQRAIAAGESRYNMYGGLNHPSGRPMGLSTPNASDRAASSRIAGEKEGQSLFNDVMNVGNSIANAIGGAFESLDTPDAGMIVDNEVKEDVALNTTTIINTPAPIWDYASRAARRTFITRVPWDSVGLTYLNGIAQLIELNNQVMAIVNDYRYFRFKSVTIGLHYETNGFYGGLGRMIYMPSWSYPSDTTITNLSPLFSGIGEEFFANENTEIELEIPWNYPVSWVERSLFTATGNVKDLKLFGSIFIKNLTGLQVPQAAVGSINIQITMRVNGLEVAVPNSVNTNNFPNARFESVEDFTILNGRFESLDDIDPHLRFVINTMDLAYKHVHDMRCMVGPNAIDYRMRNMYELSVHAIKIWENQYAKTLSLLLRIGDVKPMASPCNSSINPATWYYKVKWNIEDIAKCNHLLSSWRDHDRAVDVVHEIKNFEYQYRQIKRILHDMMEGMDALDNRQVSAAFQRLFTEPFVGIRRPVCREAEEEELDASGPRFESVDETAASIFYYPTTNRMQGRYSTTRLAGSYQSKGIGPSSTKVADLSQVWTLIGTAPWAIGATANFFNVAGSVGSALSQDMTMINYLGTFAANWSGTLEVKVQIARTSYHQGKLMAAWVPYTYPSLTSNLSTFTMHPHVILDINESSEFIIRLPNTSVRPVRYTLGPGFNYPNDWCHTGKLSFIPFAPLVGTTIVGNSVDCVFWIRGVQDGTPNSFRLYNPRNVTFYNRSNNTAAFEAGEISICEDIAQGEPPIGYEEIVDLCQLLSRTQPIKITATEYSGGTIKTFPPIGYSGNLNFALGYGGGELRYPNLYHMLITPIFTAWYGDTDIMLQGDVDLLIARQMPVGPNNNVGGNPAFGSGPGMVRFQNATTMITCKLSPYGVNNFFSFQPEFWQNVNPDLEYDNPWVTPSSLVIDTYSSTTKQRGNEVLMYMSAASNFILKNYCCLPDLARFRGEVGDADSAARNEFPPSVRAGALLREIAAQESSIDDSLEDDEVEQLLSGRFEAYDDGMPPRASTSTPPRRSTRRVRVPTDEVSQEEDDEPPLGFFSSIAKIPQNVESMTNQLACAAKAIRKTAERTNTGVEHGVADIESFIQSFTEISPGDLGMGVIMVMDLVESLMLNKVIKWTGFMLKLATALSMRFSVVHAIFLDVKSYFFASPNQSNEGNDNEARFESIDDPNVIAMLLSVAVMAIGAQQGGVMENKKKLGLWEFMAGRGREAHNMKMGIAAFTEGYDVIHDTIVEGLTKYVYNDDPNVFHADSTRSLYRKLEKLSADVKELHEYENIKFILYQPERRAKFKKLYNDINEVRHAVTVSHDREARMMYLTMKSHVDDLVSAAMDNSPDSSVRIDPPHYYFYGEPGIGKSSVTTAFAKAILLSQNQSTHNNIYCRTEASKFHDNYKHQYVYQIDDGNMLLDPEIAMESIQRKSNVPMVLEMADLKKKGMYFTSKCIMTSSNTPYPVIPGITKNEALLRRRDMLIECKKAPDATGIQPDFSHLRFRLYDPLDRTKSPSTPSLTLEEMIERVVCHHGNYLAKQIAFVKGIQPDIAVDKVYVYSEAHNNLHLAREFCREVVAEMRDACALVADDIVPGTARFEMIARSDVQRDIVMDPGARQLILENTMHRALYNQRMTDAGMPRIEPPTGDFDVFMPVTPISSRELQDNTFVGIARNPIEAYCYVIRDGQTYIYPTFNDAVTRAIIADICADHYWNEDELLTRMREQYPLISKFKFNVQSLLNDTRVHARSLFDRFLDMASNIGMTTLDFFISVTVSPELACVLEDENLIGAHIRTDRRFTTIFDSLNDAEGYMLRTLPPVGRLVFMFQRLLLMIPYYSSLTFSYILNRLMKGIGAAVALLIKYLFGLSLKAKLLIGAIFVGFIMYKMMRKEKPKIENGKFENVIDDSALPLQDHYHHDLPDDGKPYVHAHLCMKCNRAYTHVHKKNTYEYSIQFPHLCHVCIQKRHRKNVRDVMTGLNEVDLAKSEDPSVFESVHTNSSPKERVNIVKFETTDEVRTDNLRTEQQALQILTKARLEGTSDPNAIDIATKVFSNQGQVWCGLRRICYVGIRQRIIVTATHLFKGKHEDTTLIIERLGMRFEVRVMKKDIHICMIDPMTTDEFCFVDLSDYPQIPAFADITHLFISEKDVGNIKDSNVMMQIKSPEATKMQRFGSKTEIVGRTKLDNGVISGFVKGVKYNVSTQPGECGSPIFLLNARVPGKIVALHCIGFEDKDFGYGFMVTKERLMSLKGRFECASAPPLEHIYSFVDPVDDCDLPNYAPSGRHAVFGKLKTQAIPSPMKSDIIMSPLFDKVFKHTTEPVCLTKNDPRNISGNYPLQLALQKFDSVAGGWNYYDRIIAREHSLKEFVRHTELYNGPKELLTIEQAIDGVPGFLEPLNMRTSPGYPYILNKKSSMIGKTSFFHDVLIDGEYHKRPNADLLSDIELILDTAQKERWCINNFYMDWLKDERRKLDRVRAGKTRMFNIHSVAWLIVMRMFYGSAVAAYTFAGCKNGSTIGINMHGTDVTELITHLKTAGDNWWDLDVSNFDGTCDNESIFDALYVLKGWTRYHNPNIDHTLDIVGDSIYWRLHVIGTIMYTAFLGVPSGWFLTAIVDTVINGNRRKMTWRSLMREHDRPDLASLNQKQMLARDVGNGDDILGAVHDSVAHIFNPDNIAAHWRKHGVVGTPPTDKEGGAVSGFRIWEQVTYLKCNFAHHESYPELYVARMNSDTIKELVNWIRISNDDVKMLLSNISDMERFLYTHGEREYNNLLDAIQSACLENSIPYVKTAYDVYDVEWAAAHELF